MARTRLARDAQAGFPEGGLKLFPVDQVLADGVDPALVPPLGEEVVLAVVVGEAVEVVDPTFLALAGI